MLTSGLEAVRLARLDALESCCRSRSPFSTQDGGRETATETALTAVITNSVAPIAPALRGFPPSQASRASSRTRADPTTTQTEATYGAKTRTRLPSEANADVKVTTTADGTSASMRKPSRYAIASVSVLINHAPAKPRTVKPTIGSVGASTVRNVFHASINERCSTSKEAPVGTTKKRAVSGKNAPLRVSTRTMALIAALAIHGKRHHRAEIAMP